MGNSMEIVEIPFVKHVGIQQTNDILSLEYDSHLLNHLDTLHAGALFTLAETASGIYLQSLFPEYKDKVLPLLRSSNIQYKKPTTKNVFAYASVERESQEKFEQQLLKKNRGVIIIYIDLKDTDEVIVMSGEFHWYVELRKI